MAEDLERREGLGHDPSSVDCLDIRHVIDTRVRRRVSMRLGSDSTPLVILLKVAKDSNILLHVCSFVSVDKSGL